MPKRGQICRLFSVLLFLFALRADAQPVDVMTAKDLKPHLEYLASPDRRGRDDWGKIEAGDYIIKHFEELDLKPLFPDGFLQAVPDLRDESDDPLILGRNIGAYIPGTDPKLKDEWIIVNAHYDHLGVRKGKVFPGADDNASGVSMLLEVARQFAVKPAKRSVAFVAFDLEEQLLWGSRWFISHCPIEVDAIKFCLTADMISRSLGGLDLPVVFVMGAETSPQVREVIDQVEIPKGLEIACLGTDIVGMRSDYGPFRLARIPFLFFSTGEHPDYHTPNDTLERIDIDKAARISTVMGRVARNIADFQKPIIWDVDREPKLSEVRAVNRVATSLLEANDEGDYELSNVQRFFISQVKAKTAYMLKQKRISVAERKLLVRLTQAMMYSTF